MRKLTRKLALALSALAAVGLAAGAASARNLALDAMAAALAMPVITGGQAPNTLKNTQGDVIVADNGAVTFNTVTNGRSTAVLLRVDVISGDPVVANEPIDRWQSDSFDCLLTGRETTVFTALSAGAGSIITVECSTPQGPLFPIQRTIGARAQNGILFLAAADPATGRTISENVLFGDTTVFDLGRTQAYSFGAIPFQAGHGFNDGDKVYRFDGEEYANWPSVVATNFLAPNAVMPVPGNTQAELILFTLDGTTGNPTVPRVAVSGLAYNDDEMPFDFQHEFDCFDIVSLGDLSVNFTQPFLGSTSGHLQLVPQPVGTGVMNDIHDARFGDGNASRRRPVHGWIVQNVVGQAAPVLSLAWGRPLAMGHGALVPFLNDRSPTLNAGPF